MEDFTNEYLEGLETHKWVGVKDLSKQFDISHRTVFQWLKDGKIEGVKWKNRRLINVVSVMGYLIRMKVIEVGKIKNKEMVKEIELNQFKEL